MTTEEIQSTYGRIIQSLDQRALKPAFDSFFLLTANSRIYLFRDELNELQETYKRLLYYYATGSKDPMQGKIYMELLLSLYELTDMILQKILIVDSPKLYYSVRRMRNIHTDNIILLLYTVLESLDIQNISLAESSIINLFKAIWTSASLSEDEVNGLLGSLQNRETTDSPGYMTILNCQIVSALILGLQEFFDKRKMQLLIHAADSRDEQVKLRAYVGILLTLYRYKNRIDCYPDIKYRIESLVEKEEFNKIVYEIILRFILSRETEKISKKMKDEILPEMMKLHPNFNSRTSSGDLPFENFEIEMNPEWMEKLSNSPIGKKLEEFNKLQEEGADVMHLTFVHLKNFPFFQEISNWFMPFHQDLSSLSEVNSFIKSFELITDTGLMCNSDIYSFYFSMKQIPEEKRNWMIGQLESQLSEWKQQNKPAAHVQEDCTVRIVGQYVQDLYRFYKLYPRRNEFLDIFTLSLDFHNLPLLQFDISDVNKLLSIADYYLGKNYFEDALAIYNRISDAFERDEMLFQKKGYCYQMTSKYTNALEEYDKAELINSESKWLLRNMAQCYRAVKQPQKAIEYYLRLESADPENISILSSIGACYIDMKDYPEALKYYYKVDYLDRDRGKAWRPIAWFSLLTGKYDQARNYYSKILSKNPDYQDYINSGHTEWVLQNIKGAMDFYKKSIAAANNNFDTFKTSFTNDIPELIAAGIERNEISLLLDKLHYAI